MSSAKFDPVEAAKIKAPPGKGKGPKVDAAAPQPEAASAAAPPPPQAEPAQPAVPPSPARALGGLGYVPGFRSYRVAKTKSFSWGGNVTQLQAGAIVDPSSFGGAPGLEKLAAQGVELVGVE